MKDLKEVLSAEWTTSEAAIYDMNTSKTQRKRLKRYYRNKVQNQYQALAGAEKGEGKS